MPTPTNRSERVDVALEGAMRNPADHATDSYEVKRLAQLEVEIARLDTAMADARHRIEGFVENHPQQRTTFANGLLVGRIGAMQLRHPALRSLEIELDNLVALWHRTLKEFADLKGKLRQG
jgi:hypothetical protein